MKLRLVITLLGLVLLAACAKQGYPSGGPKDTAPPVLLAAKPANGTLGFDAKEFFLEFDEYVTIKDAENNILVSPPMKQKPEYATKGHGIRVRIKDTLQPATTYLFQFKGAVVDFTEGNALPSVEYVFSTGSSIDSMAITGTVTDAVTGQVRKETVTLMAYAVADPAQPLPDSLAMTTQPTYITRADANGRFAFNHIKAGLYHLVALEDVDKNLRLAPTEAMAFADTLVPAHHMADSVPVALRLSETDSPKPQRVLKSEMSRRGHARVVAARPTEGLRVVADSAVWRLNAGRDTIDVWHLNPECDSMTVMLADSTGLADTLRLKYRQRPASRRPGGGAADHAKTFVRPQRQGRFAYFDTVRLLCDNPVVQLRRPDSAATVLNLADSTVRHCRLRLAPDSMAVLVQFEPKPGANYRVTIAPRTLVDIYGHRNDTLTFGLQATRAEDYGNIIVHFAPEVQSAAYVLQLLDAKGLPLAERCTAGAATLRFEHMAPATYTLRAIVDRNANGRYDGGNYAARRQPEQVIYFDKPLELRANWDIEERFNAAIDKDTVISKPKTKQQ